VTGLKSIGGVSPSVSQLVRVNVESLSPAGRVAQIVAA
jgi:hypothetical protein